MIGNLELNDMLNGLRDFARSWPGKILGAFLLVGVAGFGINNVITDLGSNTVASVGGEEITSREFLRAYQRQMNVLATRIGRVPSADEAQALGLPSAVLIGLSENATLDWLTGQLDLGVSEDKLGQMLRADPSFQGTLGTFDPASFSAVLQASGLTEAEYFELLGGEAKRAQVLETLFAERALPMVGSDLVQDYAQSRRTIDYIALSELNIDPVPAPTEAEMAAYLSAHQGEYRTVETRKVRLLDLSVPALAATKPVDDAAIAAEYERIKDSLTRPERRHVEQLVLDTPEARRAFDEGLAAGTDFATLAAQTGLSASPLGTLTRAEITDPVLAEAAFGLQEGQFTLIDGVTGPRAIHVSTIEPAHRPTLDEAKKDIAERLAQTRARAEITDILDQVEELRAAFRPLPDIAERFDLPLYEVDVTAGGDALEALPNLEIQDRASVSQAIFKAEAGQLTPSIPLAGNAHVFFELLGVEPARDQTLEEVREDLAATMTAERTTAALGAKGDELVERLEAGETLADIAGTLNLFPQISRPFTRFGVGDDTIDDTVAQAAFAGGPAHKGSAVDADGRIVVFQVVDSTAPVEPMDEQTRADLQSQAYAGLYNNFVAALRDDAGLHINEQTLNQVLARTYGP